MKYFAELALIPEGWSKNVRVTIDLSGKIESVESGIEPNHEDIHLKNRILLPALSNLHSHCFSKGSSWIDRKAFEE